jgi:hypothetical protein
MSEEPLHLDLASIPPDRLSNAVSLVAEQKYACKDCGILFALSETEILYFLAQNLHLPKRCTGCRKDPAAIESTPASLQGKFFADADPTRIPMVPWRHT